MKYTLTVTEKESGERLDKAIADLEKEVTRSSLKACFEGNGVLVNGKPSKPSKTVKNGDKIEFELVIESLSAEPENLPLNIVYEDDDLAIIDKPQGMTVHPAPGHSGGTLVNAILYHFNKVSDIGGEIRPGIVHRIDKDTSGLLVVAKNNKAHLSLAKQISSKTCKRTYLALVVGNLKNPVGVVDAPIGRDPKDRKKMAIVPNGKRAVTHYKELERYKGYSLVQFDLETGRTHQIRVHTKSLGHPIVGDMVYGSKDNKFKLNGQLLHAYKLKLVQPTTKKIIEVTSPLPDYFEKVLLSLKKSV